MSRAHPQDSWSSQAPKEDATGRPWLGIYFTCSGRYQRVFRNESGTGYLARCASCGRCVRFAVGPGGTNERLFRVSCEA